MTGPPSRPDVLVVVTGTGTEVGKTWVGTAFAREARSRGVTVAARKPVQSFAPDDAQPHDADVLAGATGEDPDSVCPRHRSYPLPMAPPMAAEALGLEPFTIADLVAETTWPEATDVGLVEGAGGPRSPLAADGDTVDLVRALGTDMIVLVADAGLGAINGVRLSHAALRGIAPVSVLLNRYDDSDDLHRRNREWLTRDADVLVDVASLVERSVGQRP